MESTIENGTKRKRRSKFDIPPEQMPQFAATISTGDSDSGIVKRKSNFDVPPDSINSLAADNFLKFAMTPSLMQDQFEGVYVKDEAYEEKLKKGLQKNFEYIRRKDRLALNPAAAPVSNVTGTSVFGFSAQTVAPKKASSVPSSKSGIGAVNQINRQRQEMNSIYVAGLPKDMTESDLGKQRVGAHRSVVCLLVVAVSVYYIDSWASLHSYTSKMINSLCLQLLHTNLCFLLLG
mmetsp:Transcript_5818/g.8855  ORF Transcript_5818/g.8855 Transcript_5818/m.8855 type:complete len:234 (+) Transcript_5818:64-765(+)